MPAKVFGYLGGVVYALLGVAGFLWTGFEHWVEAEGRLILAFEVNPTHNLAHVAVGAALLWAASGTPATARIGVGVVGAVYLALGVAGFWLTGAPDWNILAINTADNWLHLATGLLAIACALAPTATTGSGASATTRP